jgi:hypothetical protein
LPLNLVELANRSQIPVKVGSQAFESVETGEPKLGKKKEGGRTADLNVYEIASLGHETPIITPKKPVHVYGKRHSIYGSALLASHGDRRLQPGFHNVMRLAACLGSLMAGLIGGFIFRCAAVGLYGRRNLAPPR